MCKRFRKRALWLIASVFLLAYLISYIVLTQYRYEQFRHWGARGFWYVSWEDETSKSWERKERAAGILYGPLHFVEYDLLGEGEPHAACSPFFGLSR